MAKKISAVVRTYKRPSVLRECIMGLTRQTLPAGGYEIIVIDNDPSGSAREITGEISQERNISMKYFVQPEISNSKTANKGIQESGGEIIAFIDDDAIPDKNWLEKIEKSFKNDAVKIVTGKILLLEEKSLPQWVSAPLKKMLGKTDIGEESRRMNRKELPLLGNFAVKKEVFNDVGLFSERIGYQERRPFGGEETAFAIAARRKGYDIYYNPEMVVTHQIQHKKITRSFFIRKKYWEGRGIFVTNRMFYPLPCVIFIFFFRVFAAIPLLTALFLVSFLDSERKHTMALLCRIFRNIGYGVQALL